MKISFVVISSNVIKLNEFVNRQIIPSITKMPDNYRIKTEKNIHFIRMWDFGNTRINTRTEITGEKNVLNRLKIFLRNDVFNLIFLNKKIIRYSNKYTPPNEIKINLHH